MGTYEDKIKTKRVLIKYARNLVKTGYFNWERIANEIRGKNLDYDYYESFFSLSHTQNAYDWINGNKKWHELLDMIRSGKTTSQIIRIMQRE